MAAFIAKRPRVAYSCSYVLLLSRITYLTPSTWPSIKKSQSTRSAMDLHLLPFLLGSRLRNDLQHFIGDLLLSASAAVRLVDGRAFCLFSFFFLLSIAQRIRSKPPPSHMKVLSFVRDVRTFEMTPNAKALCYLIDSRGGWRCSLQRAQASSR